MRTYIPFPRQYIHQGPLVQQTFPVPPQGLPVPARTEPVRQMNRFMVGAKVDVHSGSTIQQTFPVPGVSLPQQNRVSPKVLRDPNYIAQNTTGPNEQLQGASVQQTFPVPGVSLPPRWMWPPRTPFRETYFEIEQLAAPQSDIFTLSQPDVRRLVLRDLVRQLGVTAQQLDSPKADGLFTAQTTVIPYATTFFIPKLRLPIEGTTPQSYEFTVSQPDVKRLVTRELTRQLGGPQEQFEGAIISQTYEFTVSQPEMKRFTAREYVRQLGGPEQQFEGATVQNTFEFKVSLPDTRWTRAPFMQQLPKTIDVAAVVSSQSDVFTLGVPDIRWFLRRPPLQVTQQLDGAIVQATFEFKVGVTRVAPARYNERMTGPDYVPDGAGPKADGLFTAQTTIIPYSTTFFIPKLRLPIEGVTVQAPQSYEFTVSLPANFIPMSPNRVKQQAQLPIMELIIIVDSDVYPMSVSQPDRSWYKVRQYPTPVLTLVNPAPVTQSDVFALLLQNIKSFLRQPPPAQALRLEGPIVQQTFEFQVSLPKRPVVPFQQQLPEFIDTTVAAVVQSDVFSLSEPDNRYFLRRPTLQVVPQLDGTVTVVQSDTFESAQPDIRYFLRRPPLQVVPQLDGAISQATFEFSVSKPDVARLLVREYTRRIGGTVTPLDTIQQTYEFTVGKPDMARFMAREYVRKLGGPVPQFDNIASAATFEFKVSLPEMRRLADLQFFRRPFGPTPQVTGPTVQQTYEFVVSKPEMQRFLLKEYVRRLGGPIQQLTGPRIQATFEFVVSGPTQAQIIAYHANRLPVPTTLGSGWDIPARFFLIAKVINERYSFTDILADRFGVTDVIGESYLLTGVGNELSGSSTVTGETATFSMIIDIDNQDSN